MDEQRELHKIAEGREAEIFAWEDGTVLRLMRSPDAQQAVEWQAEAMRGAALSGVWVPAVHGTTTVDGRPGLIMERVDGPDMLTLIGRRPWSVFSVGRISGEVHAQLHEARAPEHIPDMKGVLRRRIPSRGLVPLHLVEFALAALDELPDGDSICHGDFHPGNLIQTAEGPFVIDWTNVTRGDPVADYVRTELMIQLGDPPPGSSLMLRVLALVGRKILVSAYKRAYRKRRPVDEALVERWGPPVMANRLVDGIEPERPKLLRLLEERLAASTG